MDAQVNVRRDVADVAAPAQQTWDITVHLEGTLHLDGQTLINFALKWTENHR